MSKVESILIRVGPEVVEALDELAKKRKTSRATILRNLLANCGICYEFLESEWRTQQPDMVELEAKMAEEIINELPEEYATSKKARVLSRLFWGLAKTLEEGGN